MFALAPAIKARLALLPSLDGWQLRTNLDEVPRTAYPAVEIRADEGGATDRGSAALVDVGWGVHLIVTKSETAADALDAAFAEVVASLHNWKPGTAGGVPWGPLKLAKVEPSDVAEQGLVAHSLIFRTTATLVGQKP